MEFLAANYINTTTQIAVNSNTNTASNLFNRDPLFQYYSEGLSTDGTTASIVITFGATTPVSRIGMLGINFKEFIFFYNGSTANTFALQNADTSTSSYITNADSNKFFRFATTQCSSITVQAKSTQVANNEKIIGLLLLSDLQFSLTLIPSADKYKPKIIPKQIVHKLSDGGTRIHNIRKKKEVNIGLDYISEAQRDLLFELYDTGTEFNFCPFGTASGFDGYLFEAVWDGPFNFYEFSDNATSSGFSGSISMKETPI